MRTKSEEKKINKNSTKKRRRAETPPQRTGIIGYRPVTIDYRRWSDPPEILIGRSNAVQH